MNQTIKTILERSSLRTYKDKSISEEDLKIILECALRAPTAGNMMPYSIIVVKNQELKNKLSQSCDNQPFIAKAPVLLIFLADFNKWYRYYINNNTEEFINSKQQPFEGPSESNLFLAIQDSVIAAENVVIAAQTLGIGSCYIGDIMEKVEYHRELLKLPKYVYPTTMLTLGYCPDNYNIPLKDRFPKEFVIFDEYYKDLSKDDITTMFENKDKLFSNINKYNAENYAQQHYLSKTKADFSKEMTRSIKEMLKEWNGNI